MCHSSTQCPGTSLHMISFTRPSPRLVLQATNAGVRKPEGLGMRPANSCTTWKISAELLLVPFLTISGFLVCSHDQIHQFVCQKVIIFQGRPFLGDQFYGTSIELRDLCHSKATPKLYPGFWSTATSISSKYIFARGRLVLRLLCVFRVCLYICASALITCAIITSRTLLPCDLT